jgi:hypothetical protein
MASFVADLGSDQRRMSRPGARRYPSGRFFGDLVWSRNPVPVGLTRLCDRESEGSGDIVWVLSL